MGREAERKHERKSSRSSRDDRKRDKSSSSSRRHYRSRSRSEDKYSDNEKQPKRHRRSKSSRDERSKHTSSRRHRESGGGESKEDRLLRKAKEYVAQQEKQQQQQKDHQDKHKNHRHGDDGSTNKSHDSDSSQEEGRRKRKRKSSRRTKRDTKHDDYDKEDDDDKYTRKDKKKDRKKHKSSKKKDHHSKSSSGKKAKSSVAKIINRDHLVPLGTVVGSPPSPLLNVEKDYFAFHQHLWVYLYREEGIAFGDLTSEEAREAFGRFTTKYNSGQLEGAYYDPKGLPSEAVDQCKTTRHTWSFNTSTTEQQRLQILQEGVRKQTEYNDPTTASKKKLTPPSTELAAAGSKRICMPVPQSNNDYRKRTPTEIAADRAANKRLRTHIKTAEDEFSGGRKDGRERQIEQRKERAARIHGSAQDREELRMGGGPEMDDKDIYGGGAGTKNDHENFESALAREKRNKARRDEKRSSRVTELQEKEQERQEAMLKSLGLTGIKAGQKITIAPRRDA